MWFKWVVPFCQRFFSNKTGLQYFHFLHVYACPFERSLDAAVPSKCWSSTPCFPTLSSCLALLASLNYRYYARVVYILDNRQQLSFSGNIYCVNNSASFISHRQFVVSDISMVTDPRTDGGVRYIGITVLSFGI